MINKEKNSLTSSIKKLVAIMEDMHSISLISANFDIRSSTKTSLLMQLRTSEFEIKKELMSQFWKSMLLNERQMTMDTNMSIIINTI